MNHADDYDKVGDYKISWTYIPANEEYTIMAQQMYINNDDLNKRYTSLRQWNPNRIDVPWGEDNGSPVDEVKVGACYCLFICSCVASCF